eukprot:gb/GEZN01005099.1/.p1 GENE.gb/GEZN01005099.1/~~gb/GEZN01005099.1/.p1  ORF type:complete len:609 (+),score=114.84 gb/GEZN01005099.1/:213-1829(+)
MILRLRRWCFHLDGTFPYPINFSSQVDQETINALSARTLFVCNLRTGWSVLAGDKIKMPLVAVTDTFADHATRAWLGNTSKDSKSAGRTAATRSRSADDMPSPDDIAKFEGHEATNLFSPKSAEAKNKKFGALSPGANNSAASASPLVVVVPGSKPGHAAPALPFKTSPPSMANRKLSLFNDNSSHQTQPRVFAPLALSPRSEITRSTSLDEKSPAKRIHRRSASTGAHSPPSNPNELLNKSPPSSRASPLQASSSLQLPGAPTATPKRHTRSSSFDVLSSKFKRPSAMEEPQAEEAVVWSLDRLDEKKYVALPRKKPENVKRLEITDSRASFFPSRTQGKDPSAELLTIPEILGSPTGSVSSRSSSRSAEDEEFFLTDQPEPADAELSDDSLPEEEFPTTPKGEFAAHNKQEESPEETLAESEEEKAKQEQEKQEEEVVLIKTLLTLEEAAAKRVGAILHGYLYKKSSQNNYVGSKWQKRYFVLNELGLCYLKNHDAFCEGDSPLALIPITSLLSARKRTAAGKFAPKQGEGCVKLG